MELAIKNGTVIDPFHKVSAKLNIGVDQGKIVALTKEDIAAEVEVDAEGLIVCPGFIDMHMHEDSYQKEQDTFDLLISNCMLKMGVTTAIGGNCGIGARHPVEYLKAVDRLGYPINLGLFVPHESIRQEVGTFSRYESIDPKYMKSMQSFLQEQLEGGCLGLSLGLEYDPGINSEEAISLMSIAGKNKKLVAIHQRSDGNQALAAIEEIIQYADQTHAKLQISHLSSMCSFGNMEDVLSFIDTYRIKGIDIGFDGYPYDAFCTFAGSAIFDTGFLKKYNYGAEYFAKLCVASSDPHEQFDEKTFYQFRESNPDALIVADLLNEAEVDRCLSHPCCIVVSDGLYSNGQGHPRGSGTFPRLIHEYVVHKKTLTLDGAIEKMTSMPAKRLGLSHKGTLGVGADADITIFDLNKIKDQATYRDPFKQPTGIEYVLINGQIALKHGEIIQSNLGKAVRA